jgi:methyl-accepting chemotaxis protein
MNKIDFNILNMVGEEYGVEISEDFVNMVENYVSECDETFKKFVMENGVDKDLYIESISNNTSRIEEIANTISEDNSLTRTQLKQIAAKLLEISSHMNYDSSAIRFCSGLETATNIVSSPNIIKDMLENMNDLLKIIKENEKENQRELVEQVNQAYYEGKVAAYQFYLRNGHFKY